MKQSRTRVEEPALSRSQELYAPRRSRTGKTVAWSLLWAASAWAFSNIAGMGVVPQTLVICAGVLGVVAMGIAAHRHWKAHEVTPTQIRAAVAAGLPGVELPRGSVKTTGYQFGRVLTPTAPRKVIIRAVPGQPPLPDLNHDPKVRQKVVSSVAVMAGATYRIEDKKTKPGRRIVLSRYVVEAEKDDLTDAQKQERRFSTAATDLLGEGTSCRFTWKETPEQGEHLAEILVTAADGKQLALANKKKTTIAQLRTRLPGSDFSVQVDPQSDQIVFKRKIPLPAVVVPPAKHQPLVNDDAAYHRFKVPIAVGDGGEQVVWHPSNNPHCMIVGQTGKGKTVALHGVIQALCQAGWRVWLIDGKRIEFLGYEGYPNVEFLAQRVDEQIRLVNQAREIMDQRMEMLRKREITKAELDPIAIVIDEVTALRDFMDERWDEVKGRTKQTGKSPAMKWLDNVARLARSMKVHLVYGLQRPDTTIINGEARDNFGARISMGALESADGSVMMWGNGAIGRQVPDIKGRAIGRINNVPTQVQVAYTANPDPAAGDYHAGMVAAQWPKQTFHTQKLVTDAVPSDESVGVTWADILSAPVVDAEGNPVEFDPVSSPESREMRKQRTTTADVQEMKLRVAANMDEALALFPAPRGTTTAGDPVARLVTAVQESPFMPSHDPMMKNAKRIAAKRSREKVPAQSAPSGMEAPAAFEPAESSFTEETEGESYPATAVEVRPDHRLSCDELSEEILVGEVLPTETGVVITGYTDDGVEHVIELENEDAVLIGGDADGD